MIRNRALGRLLPIIAVAALLALPGGAFAQMEGTLLILSRPAAGVDQSEFINFAPFVALELRATGSKLDPLTFTPNLPSVREALNAKTISALDLIEPIGRDSIRKIARALGCRYLLLLDGRNARDGVEGNAEMDLLVGQQSWSTFFTQKLEAYKPAGKKPSLLEGINAHAATIVARITGGSALRAAGPAVEVKVPAPKSTAKAKQTKEKPTRVAQQPKDKPTRVAQQPKTDANVEAPAPPEPSAAPPTSDPPKTAGKDASNAKTEKPKTVKPKTDKPKKPDSRSKSATIAKKNVPNAIDSPPATTQTAPPVPGASGQPIRVAQGDRSRFVQPTVSGRQTIDPPVAENPNVVSANEILVDRFRRQGDLANMIVSMRRAITEKPHDVRLRRDLVQTYLERGWQSAARDEASRAVALSPADASLHRLLGDSFAGSGDPENALKEYEEAVRLDPKDGANHVALGDGYLIAAKAEEARKAFQTATEADPRNPLPYRRLARLYAQRGRYKECAEALAAARERTPAEDLSTYNADYLGVLETCDASLTEVLARLKGIRQATLSGVRTREKLFAEASAEKKRSEDLSAFLESLQPATGYGRIQDLYLQAASLVTQAAESALLFIETQESRRDDEATLARVEAEKSVAEANKRLKAVLAPKPSRAQ